MADDLLGFGKLAEAVERGTREVREVIKAYAEPIAKAKGHNRATEIQLIGLQRIKKMVGKADRMLSAANRKRKSLNEKIVIPVLEHTFRETQDELIERWAGLLASSLAGDPVHNSFPRILSEITPAEAQILDQLFKWREGRSALAYSNTKVLQEEIGLSEKELVIASENLLRLRLCAADSFLTMDAMLANKAGSRLYLTYLGVEFVKVCQGPDR
jgi:hypothetical protein